MEENITQKTTGYADSEFLMSELLRLKGWILSHLPTIPPKHIVNTPEYKALNQTYVALYSILESEYDMQKTPEYLDKNINKTLSSLKKIVSIARKAGIYKVGQVRANVTHALSVID